MSDIFISYTREDLPTVRNLVNLLESKNWSVWWDRKILPGLDFYATIEQEIDNARCVIVLWTKNSITSEWVRMEADKARLRNILLPVVLDEVVAPFGFSHRQVIDMKGWDGNSPHPEIDYLLDSIRVYLQIPQAAGSPAQVPVNPLSQQREHKDTPEASSTQSEKSPEATPFSSGIEKYLRSEPFDGESYYRWPPADVLLVRPGQYLIEIDLPGISPDELEVQVVSRTLIISGVRRLTYYNDSNEPEYLILEREGMRFLREFKFPVDLNGASIESNYNDGVLRLLMSLEQHEQKPQ